MRILLVEDDEQLATLVVKTLTQQNHVVDLAGNGEEGWDLLEVAPYDLVLLDVMLPKLDGMSFCKRVRQHKKEVLIMLLTARGDSSDKIMGLDAGADDYMVKPFDAQELLARIRALQRRGTSSPSVCLEWGNLLLDPVRCEVRYAGQLLSFRPKEYALLELMLRNPQRVFSRGDILNHLWTFDEPPNESTIKAHIKGIRHVLRSVKAEDLIETVYGQGYRFNPEFAKSTAKAEQVNSVVAQVWQQMKGVSFERLTVLEAAIAALKDGSFTPEHRTQAEHSAHKLAGSLGTFGLMEGSAIAAQIEEQFETTVNWRSQEIKTVTQQVKTLREKLERYSQPLELTAPQISPNTLITVLGIDDDEMLLKALGEFLRSQQINLVPLSNVDEVWTLLQTVQPDLILLDVEMPQMNGLDLCQEIRQHPQWHWIPVIFLTAHQDGATQLRGFETGADDYLTKPVVPSELATRIQNRVARTRSIRQQPVKNLS
jgi:two-component system, OmpR family, response regulator